MRAPARLVLGERDVTVFPDGRVIVTLPATAMPFGCAMSATALYPSLRAFVLATVRNSCAARRDSRDGASQA